MLEVHLTRCQGHRTRPAGLWLRVHAKAIGRRQLRLLGVVSAVPSDLATATQKLVIAQRLNADLQFRIRQRYSNEIILGAVLL